MSADLPDRIVILGAGGQLGREFQHRLPNAVALRRTGADLTDPHVLRAALEQQQPQLVLNCAAYNYVDRAEREPERAFAVNARGVCELAVICRDLKAWLVHFSTDAVFGRDRDRSTPYFESALPGPINVYGASKLAGEHSVRGQCPNHLVIRTCGLYGHRGRGGKGTNFVEAILAKARAGEPLRVVDDQFCTPSSAADVAAAALEACRRELGGLLHVTNAGCCSWFEFASAALKFSGIAARIEPIPSDQWPAAAARPHYTVLANEKACAAGIPALPHWKDSLRSYLQSSSSLRLQRGLHRIEV